MNIGDEINGLTVLWMDDVSELVPVLVEVETKINFL